MGSARAMALLGGRSLNALKPRLKVAFLEW